MGVAELTFTLGMNKVKQRFIVCRELRRNIILGVDFAKQNCAGIQWTTNRTRILSLKGVKTIEVEEDELGIPVTASYHIRIPPRHNAVFEVNIHAELQGTQVITGNRHLLEKHPNMYQHEIAIKSEKNNKTFPLMAIMNLDQVKTLHLHKGEVVGFARTESTEVTYIATTNELNIEETIDVIPRNWIPQRKWNLKSQALNGAQATFSECSESSQELQRNSEELKLQVQMGYLDDIIIFSKSEEQHLQHLEEIFTRLRKFGLKMKCEKCSFFKKHIQYLGHLVSKRGFEPLPEILESIKNMPVPRTAREVMQFLGLIAYYRKFVPCFVDISRPLTKLTWHDISFEWTEQCQKAFNHLRELLMEYPILRYPDPKQGYTLYMDASGIGWSGVLMQEFKDEKGKIKNHPICYISGQFPGSQLNWAALTKEAYAIYMSIRRLSFYVTDAEVTIKCDHLPLKKFLNKQTMNSKVNNWVVELEQFKVHLDWIPGSRNLLPDSLSHLLDVDLDASQTEEPQGHEFGSYCFEDLQPAKVLEIINTELIELNGGHSENRENSPNSREVWEVKNVELTETSRPQHQWQSQGCSSDFDEDSQKKENPAEIGAVTRISGDPVCDSSW